MSDKPHRGRIKNWSFLTIGEAGKTLIVLGDALDHEWLREGVRTSAVTKFDATTGEIETHNSRYTLVDAGDPSPRKGWPNPGDRMKFLGRNGYPHETEKALATFKVGEVYTVVRCDVGDAHHTIEFEGIPGEWNGVMFKKVSAP